MPRKSKIVAPPASFDVLRLPPHAYADRENDCAIWALSAYTSLPYERVLIEVAREDRVAGTQGLSIAQITRVARRLGFPLRFRKKPDMEDDIGILSVWLLEKGEQLGHVALLKQGQVIEANQGIMIWSVDSYFVAGHAILHGVLVAREKAE